MKKALILFMIVSLLSSCGVQKQPAKEDTKQSTTIENKTTVQDVQTVDFDLGEKVYKNREGMIDMPYKLQGTLSFPKDKGNYPLVIILHGNHDNNDSKLRFDKGFKEVGEKIAEKGFVAAAFNYQPAYDWKYGDSDEKEKFFKMYPEFVRALDQMNQDGIYKTKNKLEEKSLVQKIDFNKRFILGHSRGGEIAYELASKEKEFLGVINYGMMDPVVKETDRDIPFLTITPQYDGDVKDNEGYVISRLIHALPNRKRPIYYLYGYGMNHNDINPSIGRNDAENFGEVKLIGKDGQQKFLSDTAVDFFKFTLGKRAGDSFYNSDSSVVNYKDQKVQSLIYEPERETLLLNADSKADFKTKQAKISPKIWSTDTKRHEYQGLNMPMSGEEDYKELKLLHLEYSNKGAEVSFRPSVNDLSVYRDLRMDLVMDSSDQRNIKGQAFQIILKDKDGKEQIIEVKDHPVLEYQIGQNEKTEVEGKDYYSYSVLTPVTMIRLPLSGIKNIDLKNIEEIKFFMNQRDGGSLEIERILLEK
ncbi:MAG: dienelactone hydrolase family protein [Gallicola sp.]|nr:dienelactone hydrolase family protein [Gallicola sp.]